MPDDFYFDLRSWSIWRTAQTYKKWSILSIFFHCGPLRQNFRNIFHNNPFKIDHYKMLRLDRNRHGGGLVLYVNEQVPRKKLINYENPIVSEIIGFRISSIKTQMVDIRYL